MTAALRIVVTGGRRYADWRRVHAVLDEIHDAEGIRLLAEGGCRYEDKGAKVSADRFAEEWAHMREVPCLTVWAPWRKMGDDAGPYRNGLMLDMVKPHLVLAFPGKNGTADCVRKARARSITVREIPNV